MIAILGDLDQAKDFSGEYIIENTTARSSLMWMAPEIFNNPQKCHLEDTYMGDIWSLGCTVIEVL